MTTSTDTLPAADLPDGSSGDAWQRRFGVPWERVERAVRAVSDRAVAASRRKFAQADSGAQRSEAQPS